MHTFFLQNKKTQRTRGMSIFEVLIAAAIILMVLGGIVTIYNRFVPAFAATTDTLRAGYLVEEGLEAVHLLRDSAWSLSFTTFSTSTTYYLSYSTTTDMWLVGTTEVVTLDRFFRTMTVADVFRDSITSDIATSGVFDAGTKKVTIAVSWDNRGATTTKQASAYISNLFSN